jgi:hypothetical protein
VNLRISRTADGSVIWLHRNGSTWTFGPEDWIELQALMMEFNVTGKARVANYVEPVRERVAVAPQSSGKIAALNLADLGL